MVGAIAAKEGGSSLNSHAFNGCCGLAESWAMIRM